jgi:hypothetical protein
MLAHKKSQSPRQEVSSLRMDFKRDIGRCSGLSNLQIIRLKSGSPKVPRWMLEVIAYFDQLGCLVITPLMPVILWLILDRTFIRQLWVEMVLVGVAEAGKRSKPQ